jgi:hypothetical protein
VGGEEEQDAGQSLVRKRLQPDEKVDAAGFPGQPQELLVGATVDGDLGRPPSAQAPERMHQLDRVLGVAKKVVIPENEVAIPHAANVRDHFGYRAGEKAVVVNLFEIAVAAAIGTSARGEDRALRKMPAPDQIAPRDRDAA